MVNVVKVYISKEFKMFREVILKVNTFLSYTMISKISEKLHLQIDTFLNYVKITFQL